MLSPRPGSGHGVSVIRRVDEAPLPRSFFGDSAEAPSPLSTRIPRGAHAFTEERLTFHPYVATLLQIDWLYARRAIMTITTLTSREFNQDTSRAKKATKRGPVFITDRGKPAHVLVSFDEYLRLTNRRQGDLIDDLGLPEGVEDAVLEVPSMKDHARPADFG